MQMWTNVKKSLTTATFMPAVTTPWAHLNASVTMDSPGTVAFAQVLKSLYPKALAVSRQRLSKYSVVAQFQDSAVPHSCQQRKLKRLY